MTFFHRCQRIGSFFHRCQRIGSKAIDEKPELIAFGYGLSLLIPFLFWAQFWGTNDDPALLGIADGTFYGSPSEQLVFVHVGLGLVLRFLYNVTDQVSWYYLLQMSVLLSSFAVIAYTVLRREALSRRIRVATIAIIWMTGGIFFVQQLQFTQTAFVASAAGAALWLDSATSIRPLLLGTPLWVVAYLLRVDSFRGAAFLILPFLIATAFRLGRNWLFVAVAILGAIYGLGSVSELVYFHGDAEWSEFADFNAARGLLNSTPRLDGLAEDASLLADIGWSRNDALIFDEWFFADPTVFTTDDLQTIVDSRPAGHGTGVTNVVDAFRGSAAAGFVLLLVVALSLLMLTGGHRGRILAGVSVLSWTATMWYLGETARIPPRVFLPTIMLIAVCAITVRPLGTTRTLPAKTERLHYFGTVGCALCATILVGSLVHDFSATVVEQRDKTEQGRNLLNELSEDQTVFVWRNGLRTEWFDPKEPPGGLTFSALFSGWPEQSPDFQQRLQERGISSLSKSIALDPNVLLLTGRVQDIVLMERFIQEHHRARGLLRPVRQIQLDPPTVLYDVIVDASVTPDQSSLASTEGDTSMVRAISPIELTCNVANSDVTSEIHVSILAPQQLDSPFAYVFADDTLVNITLTGPAQQGHGAAGTINFSFATPDQPYDELTVVPVFDDSSAGLIVCS